VKRSTQRRLRQGGLYAVLLGVILYLAFSVDWENVRNSFWAEGLSGNWHDLIVVGVRHTVIYTLIAFSCGLVLALLLALMKLSPAFAYRWIATAYIELFRGLPALVTIIFMAFAVPIAFHWRPPGGGAGAGVVGLILVAGAYMAETIRAGIQAVPTGQVEAAHSLGMNGFHTMTAVVIPQAFRIVIPPLTNELVALIKDTSLLSVAGVALGGGELTTVTQNFMTDGPTAGTGTSLTQAALLYLVITLPLTQLVAWLERRQRRAR